MAGLGLERFAYEKGLCEVGDGLYAWLAPDGSWGFSNAGLVVDGERSLLVDTLFDLPMTREMLAAMRRAEPKAAAAIDVVVNTHANGDHCFGNELVAGAEIIASKAGAEEMGETPPEALAGMVKALGGQDTALGHFVSEAFGRFEFEGIRLTPPTRTFEGELALTVGTKRVDLIEVGPAHTKGDVIVHLPAERVVWTGDILFVEGTPIVWAGPVARWIDACDRILALDAVLIVPGHGPITDRRGVAGVQSYLGYVAREARARFDAGMDAWTAAQDIPLGDFAEWSDAERLAVNVDTLYREFGAPTGANILTLFGRMAELRAARRR